jgi:hypothetical protein
VAIRERIYGREVSIARRRPAFPFSLLGTCAALKMCGHRISNASTLIAITTSARDKR